ncbi:MAG: hypothetical protein E8D47_12155 [Nitrospira sp.]|nr:MAG: hypothetical protein E8D47_12155 [Nitrospira sp.]
MQRHRFFRNVKGLRVLGAAVALWLLLGALSNAWASSYELSMLKTFPYSSGNRGFELGPHGDGFTLNEKSELVLRAKSKIENGAFEIVTPGRTYKFSGLGAFSQLISSNERGEVFFIADNAIQTPDASGTARAILRGGDVINGEKLVGVRGPRVAVNDKGQVAVEAIFEGGEGIVTLDRVVVKRGSIIENQRIDSFGDYYVSENGEVLFSTGQAIFRENQLLVKAGDMIGGKTFDSIIGFSANGKGAVVFFGNVDGGKWRGVFTGDRLVAQYGDTVEGKTIQGFNRGLLVNANGDVAFEAYFTDSTEGIVLARQTTGQAQAQQATSTKLSSSFRIGPVLILLGIMCALWLFWPKSQKRS